jgi:hypothetical protein
LSRHYRNPQGVLLRNGGGGKKNPFVRFISSHFRLKKRRNFGGKNYTDIDGYVTYYFDMLSEVRSAKHAMLGEVMSAKHAWVSLEKIGKGQLGRLEEKIAAVLSY